RLNEIESLEVFYSNSGNLKTYFIENYRNLRSLDSLNRKLGNKSSSGENPPSPSSPEDEPIWTFDSAEEQKKSSPSQPGNGGAHDEPVWIP
ncbi:MAG: hypothetical protein PHP74_03595, partial [Candidatus Gracilibacteria bacterium]|nr:hypothetical protein [Candidatus Gracilibacteria bacterium]